MQATLLYPSWSGFIVKLLSVSHTVSALLMLFLENRYLLKTDAFVAHVHVMMGHKKKVSVSVL